MLALPAVVEHDQALVIAKALQAQVSSQPAMVMLDASALKQFDSSVLAVMLACRRQSLSAGKTFSVHGLPSKLGQLAGLYGVAALIPAAA